MQIVNDFTKDEKLCAMAVLMAISKVSEQNMELKEKIILEHLKLLNLTNSEFSLFIKSNPSPEYLSKILKPLNFHKKEMCIAMGWELLMCVSTPSPKEFHITITFFEKMVGIEMNAFCETGEKLKSLSNFLLNH